MPEFDFSAPYKPLDLQPTADLSIETAKTVNPDQEAARRKIAPGLAPEVVRAAHPDGQLPKPKVQLTPQAQRFFSDYDNAAIAHDDVPVTDGLLKGWNLPAATSKSLDARRVNDLQAKKARGEKLSKDENTELTGLKSKKYDETNPALDIGVGLATSIINPLTLGGAAAGAGTFAVGASVTGPGAGAAAIAGATVGGNTGQSADTANQATGEIYGVLDGLRDEKGRPYNQKYISQIAQAAGLAIGGVNFAGNYLTAGAGGKVAKEAVTQALTKPLVIKALLKGAAEGAGVNGLIGILNGVVKEGAKSSATGKVDVVAQGKEVLNEGAQGAALGAVIGGVAAGGPTAFKLWSDSAANSKLIKRVPDVARNAINEAHPEPVRIPTDRFVETARAMDKTPEELATQVGAKANATHYEISSGDYATKVSTDQPLAQILDPIADPNFISPPREIDKPPAVKPLSREVTVSGPEAEKAKELELHGYSTEEAQAAAKGYAVGLENIERILGLPQDTLHNRYGTKLISESIATPREGVGGLLEQAGLLPQEVQTLMHMDNKGASGLFRINPVTKQAEIYLGKKANLSTFSHESSHFFRRVIQDSIDEGTATPELVKIHEEIRRFVEADPTKKNLTRGQEEKFARAYEKYLRTGKAVDPTIPKGAFAKLRDMMVSVYAAAKDLKVKLTPEIEAVFERLTQARHDIEQVAPHMDESVKGEAAVKYADAVETKGAAREVRAKEEIPAMTKKLEAEHRADDVAKLVETIQKNEDFQLDDAAVRKIMGDENIELLPEGMLTEGGLHPDELAEQLGYDSGEAMLADITNHTVYDPVADATAKFDAKDPHIVLEDEAVRAVVEKMGPQIKKNADAISKERGKKFYRRRQGTAVNYGAAELEPFTGPIKQVSSLEYGRAAIKYAEDHQKYLDAGDIEQASTALRNQELAYKQYKGAKKVEKFLENLPKDAVMEDGRPVDLYQMSYEDLVNGVVEKPTFTPEDTTYLAETSQPLKNNLMVGDTLQGVSVYRALTKGKAGSVKKGFILDKFYDAPVAAAKVREELLTRFYESTEFFKKFQEENDLAAKSTFKLNSGKLATKDELLGAAFKEYLGTPGRDKGALDALSDNEMEFITKLADSFESNDIIVRPGELRGISTMYIAAGEQLGNRAFKQARADMRHLVTDPEAASALERAVGPDGFKALKDRYEIHLGMKENMDILSKWGDKFRQNNAVATVAALNPLTALKQFSDLAGGVSAYAGHGNWLKGAARVSSSILQQLFSDAPDTRISEHIKSHETNFNKEYVDSVRAVGDKKYFGVSASKVIDFGYKFVQSADLKARKIAFKAIYDETLFRGYSAAEATAHADQMVIKAFGSSDKFNQSVFEQKALGRILGTYGITARGASSLITEFGLVGSIPRGVIQAVGVSVAMSIASGYGSKDLERDPVGYMFRAFMGYYTGAAVGSVLLSSTVDSLLQGKKPDLATIYGPAGAAYTVVNTSIKASQGKEMTEKDVKNTTKAVAKLLGIPIIGGLIDMESFAEDRVNNVPLGTIKK